MQHVFWELAIDHTGLTARPRYNCCGAVNEEKFIYMYSETDRPPYHTAESDEHHGKERFVKEVLDC